MLDPRPAYAAADIVIGMGGSSLRGMAFGKPTIVVGIGSSRRFFSRDERPLLHYGLYGEVPLHSENDALVEQIRRLAGDELPGAHWGRLAGSLLSKSTRSRMRLPAWQNSAVVLRPSNRRRSNSQPTPCERVQSICANAAFFRSPVTVRSSRTR